MKAIVLAAGKGTRLHSEEFNAPKVLREANGKPLISYVLENISFIPKSDTVIVIGYKKEMVKEAVGNEYIYAVQSEQKGTGHAVQMAQEALDGYDGDVIILYGDMPLFTEKTYRGLIEEHRRTNADCTILTAVSDEKLAYGRIVRENGEIKCIVEQKDCTPEQAAIRELNVGVYVFKAKVLFDRLTKIDNNNNQGEYYLTDVPAVLIKEGMRVSSYVLNNSNEIFGVNTIEDLHFCEKILSEK